MEKEEFEGVKIENPNDDIYIPLGTLLAKFEQDPVADELDEIVIQVPEKANLPEQAAVVSSMMAGMHRQIDDFRLVVPEKLLQQNRKTQRIFNIVMGAIASISLLVGGIGIMNIMLASVLERTNEIGLRRALGARRRDISRQFLLEAVGISLAGSALGIALGLRHFPRRVGVLGLADHGGGLVRPAGRGRVHHGRDRLRPLSGQAGGAGLPDRGIPLGVRFRRPFETYRNRTSNIEHRTLNIERESAIHNIRGFPFSVQSSTFDVQRSDRALWAL